MFRVQALACVHRLVARSPAHQRTPMRTADQLLQSIEFPLLRRERCALLSRLLFLTLDLLLLTLELFLLLFDLCLLLFKCVDEEDAETVVAHAFDLAFVVTEGEERGDLLDFFSAKADVF